MLDQVKYEYITLDLPNIQVAWERGRDRSEYKFRLDSRIKELIIQAAMKFPMWRFMCGGDQGGISRNRDNEVYDCYRIFVLEGNEFLGTIDYTYRRGRNGEQTAYCLSNQRIQHKRERGTADVTKDINKALKIMAKSFGLKTIDERIREARAECEVRVGHISNRKTSDFYSDYRRMTDALRHYLMGDKWEEMKQIALTNKADLTMLDRLPNMYEDHVVAKEMESCVNDNKGVVVIIHGNDYAVQSFLTANDEPAVEMFSTDTLPEWIKRGVGMLKLVEEGNMIGKIGYKISDGAFFVMGEEQ